MDNVRIRKRSAANSSKTAFRRDRDGMHAIQAFITEDVFIEFKVLGAQQLKTSDTLITEALALLFEKNKRPIPPGIVRKLNKLKI